MSAAAVRQATVQHLLNCGGFVLFCAIQSPFVVLRRVAAIVWLLSCLGVACGVRALHMSSGRYHASVALCALLARDFAACLLLNAFCCPPVQFLRGDSPLHAASCALCARRALLALFGACIHLCVPIRACLPPSTRGLLPRHPCPAPRTVPVLFCPVWRPFSARL